MKPRLWSEHEFEALLDSAPDALVVCEADGSIAMVNRQTEQLFGFSRGELIGQPVEMLLPDRHQEEHIRQRARFVKHPEARAMGDRTGSLHGKHKNEVEFPVDVSLSPLETKHGLLVVAAVRDATAHVREREKLERRVELALRMAQEEAQQRNRLADIGALAAKIVHDLGNPLAGIVMQAQLIQRSLARGVADTKVEEQAEDLLSSARHLDTMLREFREFARDQNLKLASVDVRDFLGEVQRTWRSVARSKEIDIEVEVAEDASTVTADEGKLRRVFDNLVKNAIEAIEAIQSGPGRVTLSAALVDSRTIRFSVSDTGPGIPDSVEVFRLFETTKSQGTGLGLPVSRELVLAHGGTMTFEKRKPQGTTFLVVMPLYGPTA